MDQHGAAAEFSIAEHAGTGDHTNIEARLVAKRRIFRDCNTACEHRSRSNRRTGDRREDCIGGQTVAIPSPAANPIEGEVGNS